MSSRSPIALFTFNRPEHTRQTLEALRKNTLAQESNLHIFCDGPRKSESAQGLENIRQLRSYLKEALPATSSGFKSVTFHEQENNQGLAESILKGVSKILANSETIIVLEDDIVTNPLFLLFINRALDRYKQDQKIFTVTGYHYPVEIAAYTSFDAYTFQRACSWGWATWADRWSQANWDSAYTQNILASKSARKRLAKGGDDLCYMLEDQAAGKVNSWAIRWCCTLSENEGLCVYPTQSLVQNIGHDGSGVHCAPSTKYDTRINSKLDINWDFPPAIAASAALQKAMLLFFQIGLKTKVKRKLRRSLDRLFNSKR